MCCNNLDFLGILLLQHCQNAMLNWYFSCIHKTDYTERCKVLQVPILLIPVVPVGSSAAPHGIVVLELHPTVCSARCRGTKNYCCGVWFAYSHISLQCSSMFMCICKAHSVVQRILPMFVFCTSTVMLLRAPPCKSNNISIDFLWS